MIRLWQLALSGSWLCLYCHCASSQLATSNLRAVNILHREDPEIHEVAAQEAQKNTLTVYERIMKAPRDVPKDAERDKKLIQDTFVPGYQPNMPVLSATSTAVTLACLWFAVYFMFVYHNDRVPDEEAAIERAKNLEEPEDVPGGWLCQDRFAKDSQPDMVIVCPHPGHESNREANESETPTPRVKSVFQESRSLKTTRWKQLVTEGELSAKLNLGKVREAFMQDLLDSLPALGFQFEAFTSIDGDEIFFCITLEDCHMIEHYLVAGHGELQLRPDLETKLGVGPCDDANAAATPWVRYEKSMVEQLAHYKVIDNDNPRNVFITYRGKYPQGSLMSSRDRFRTIYRCLGASLDFDTAEKVGIIATWYPAHSLKNLQRLASTWGTFSKLTDLTFKQPIAMINEYFGGRVSYMFIWNGVYCKALLALVPLGLMWEFAGQVVPYVSTISPDEACRQILGMTIIVLVWSRIASNLYAREELFFMRKWGMSSDVKDRTIRPEYKGELKPTRHDANFLEKQDNPIEADVKLVVSAIITSLVIAFVAFAIFIWVAIFDGRMNLLASICLTIQITIFQFLFNILCAALTEWENHKYADAFYNSYLIKQFLFAFVNSYWAFLYLAIKQRHTEQGCPAGGCLWVMRKQLTTTLIILSVMRVVAVVLQTFMVSIKIWMEDRALKQELGVEELPKRSFVEEQSKYADFRTIEQVQAMLQLVVPIGYVILFGGIAPITIPFAFGVFAVSLRAQAFLFCTSTKRPLPSKQYGIGAWSTIVLVLMNASVLFSGFLLAAYGDMLATESRITKMSVVIVFMLLIFLMWGIVDFFLPAVTSTVVMMAERRKRVMHKLMETCAEGPDSRTAESQAITDAHFSFQRTASTVAILAGEWDKVKLTSDMVEETIPSGR